MLVPTRKCRKCGKTKLLSKFRKFRSKNKVGIRYTCSKCQDDKYNKTEAHRKSVIKYRNSKHGKRKARDSTLKRKFGISLEDYNKIFEEQNGLCAICGLPEKTIIGDKTIILGVDHNHLTKKVRGLLCSDCNTSIGKLKVDEFGILNLQMTIKYLKKRGN